MKLRLGISVLLVITLISISAWQQKEKTKTEFGLTQYYWFHHECPGNALIPILASEPLRQLPPYGCTAEGSNVGTTAYLPGDTETFVDGVTQKRRPKANAVVQVSINHICSQ